MSEPHLELIRAFLSDPRIGDGFRNTFILARKRATAVLFVQAELVIVTVPLTALAKAKPLAYRPAYLRERLLTRVALYRRQGWRFPRAATIEFLRRPGTRGPSLPRRSTRRRCPRFWPCAHGVTSASPMPPSWPTRSPRSAAGSSCRRPRHP